MFEDEENMRLTYWVKPHLFCCVAAGLHGGFHVTPVFIAQKQLVDGNICSMQSRHK
jgi:hypothetical protein